MATQAEKNQADSKVKCPRFVATQLVVVNAWERTFTSGKKGFFGQVLDPASGKRYQITAAVEIQPK